MEKEDLAIGDLSPPGFMYMDTRVKPAYDIKAVSFHSLAGPLMQSLHVNGYDMPYLEVGHGQPLVCVHGTLGDFRTWYVVLGPLSRKHRVSAVSLRHFFPEHWDGAVTEHYRMARHVSDTIGFIEQSTPRPVDLMGHSRRRLLS